MERDLERIILRLKEKFMSSLFARAEDYIQVKGLPEIGWKEILKTARAHCKGYYSVDIANLVARELGRDGIKIWR